MARPKRVVELPKELAEPTPTQVVQQMEKAFHPNHGQKVTVDEFFSEWNRVAKHFQSASELNEGQKPLLKAILKSFSLLKE